MFNYQDGFIPNRINQNTLNDFNKLQYQTTNFNLCGADVKLYVFKPQFIPVQVARPFVYQFTPDFVDEVKSGVNCQMAVGPHGTNSDAIKRAILPDSNGMVLNTSTFQNMYSFVLIIDSGNEMSGGIMRPGVRQVAMGYVTDEPLDQFNNPNPSAVLMFTHNTVTMIRRSAGADTPMDGLKIYTSQDVDYASEAAGMVYNDKVLLGTPREIMMHAQNQMSSPSSIIDYTDLDLNHVVAGANTKMIDNSIKAPRKQLSDIMTALDNGIEDSTTSQPTLSRFTDNSELGVPPNVRAYNTAMNNMPSSASFIIQTGLDTSIPMPMTEFAAKYPDAHVYPCAVVPRQGYGWDVANQATYCSNGQLAPIMSMRNQMSFLASSVVQSVCGAHGITNVAFSYMFLRGTGFEPAKKEAFQLQIFDLVVPRPQPVLEAAAMTFRKLMTEQLFDVIGALSGEFEIHVMANMGGEILVNLKLYDFPDPQDGAYYQTSARLSSLLNPMIGDINTINNNVCQLSNMAQAITGSAFGDVYSNPLSSFDSQSLNMFPM